VPQRARISSALAAGISSSETCRVIATSLRWS
jgi:hypothetical protein